MGNIVTGIMRIGIDDTDSPRTMCTTYLGAALIRKLCENGIQVSRAYLVRLNPNVTFKTRGNAAIALDAEGDPRRAFALACHCVDEMADLGAENTHPGVVVAEEKPTADFYQKAVQDFCTLEETISLLENVQALYRGYKNGRGLIGATAAVAAEFRDMTYEWLSYRHPSRWGSDRYVDAASLRASQIATFPHTWDTVDFKNRVVVCVPHTPDPVLFGVRGESPYWIANARGFIDSEPPIYEQIYQTNQGTDAHLIHTQTEALLEGRSYELQGIVVTCPQTRKGGHVHIDLAGPYGTISCQAYEPTKGFREVVRSLIPGDQITITGSYKRQSINLEKLYVESMVEDIEVHPPYCTQCDKRMTSAGHNKGFKCRSCNARSMSPSKERIPRHIKPGWYEVPSCARRHLAKPLIRNALDAPGESPGNPF